ncbi:CxxxxCH/CxxCH domain-containing protein [Marinobacter shengliensis]|uniref:CxxxxCH/CxxCH domain-containing protein n=1 Tax=Marinobacter shengliensis TaxID=1389223 RepID=A0ABV4W3F9_9GAMM
MKYRRCRSIYCHRRGARSALPCAS